jgi:DNA ligase-1
MAKFRAVAELAEALSRETGRLKKRAAIAKAIATAHAEDPEGGAAGLFALYLAGTPFAEADPRKLNAGGALLSRVLLKVSGANDIALTAAYRRYGDMGAAAFDLLAETAGREATLMLAEVNEAFAAMAVAKTTAIRAALVEGLLGRATALEAKYLIKLMLGDMRIGVKQSLVEEAIAAAAGVPAAEVRHGGGHADVRGDAERGADAAVSSAGLHVGEPGGDARGGGGAVHREAGPGRRAGADRGVSRGQVRRHAGAGALWRPRTAGPSGDLLP